MAGTSGMSRTVMGEDTRRIVRAELWTYVGGSKEVCSEKGFCKFTICGGGEGQF